MIFEGVQKGYFCVKSQSNLWWFPIIFLRYFLRILHRIREGILGGTFDVILGKKKQKKFLVEVLRKSSKFPNEELFENFQKKFPGGIFKKGNQEY